MPELQPIGGLIFTYIISIFYGCQIFFGLLFATIVKGPRRVYNVIKRKTRPDILDSPDLGTHHFARLKHIRLHYVAKGDEKKPLMLFLHGFPDFWYCWRHALKEFSDDYRAVAVDMRGYGESEKPPNISDYTTDQLAGDIKALIEHLGYEKCLLVGHDWGGVVAYSTTQLYPEVVDKLIVMNIPHPLAMRKQLKKSLKQLRMSWYMFFFQLPYLPEIMLRAGDLKFLDQAFRGKGMGSGDTAYTEDDIEAYKYTMRNFDDVRCPINYYRANMRYKSKVRFSKIEVPTLMIWGKEDRALGHEMAEMSKEFIPDLTLHYLEGVSHWTPAYPDKVHVLMREYLGQKKRL